MDNTEIKITIDANGNIHRDIVERGQPETRKHRILKKIASGLTIKTAQQHR